MFPPFLVKSFVAGIIASFACGLGALLLLIRGVDPEKHTGIAYAAAGGLMFAASVYNLILPGLSLASTEITLDQAIPVITGILLGALFLSQVNRYLSPERMENSSWKRFGNKAQILIFVAMFIHSIPEGVAVGVGYSSETVYSNNLGDYIALAIALHNIPEGLAVAVPLRATGSSINRCYWMAFLTSLPQPIAAIPAAYISWLFKPLMPLLMGFAAGAMIFLIILELIPESLNVTSPLKAAWSFTIGFCGMILIQLVL
ncbi:MAG: ZIP family metal transporter [Deferribacteres bacterium]|nr:ZIP family metal transporter [candidate division KSB1 bacterium]MCB9502571.1 ZIP family metal transporter [Deferribacteres bacterium]